MRHFEYHCMECHFIGAFPAMLISKCECVPGEDCARCEIIDVFCMCIIYVNDVYVSIISELYTHSILSYAAC